MKRPNPNRAPRPRTDDPLVVFVCTGNVCRSPIAEFLLRARLGPGSAWRVESGGVLAAAGFPPTPAAAQVLREKGIDASSHRSRPLSAETIDAAQLVVVMTAAHREQLRRLFPEATEKVFLLKSFDAGARETDIEDPIGSPVDVYRNVRNQIEASLPGLTAFLGVLERRLERT